LPTSAIGKQLSFDVATRVIVERNAVLAVLGRLRGLVYVGMWIVFLLEFALGGMSLPPPGIPVGNDLGNTGYSLSLWAILGWLVVVMPLLYACSKRALALYKWPAWVQDRDRRPIIALLIWTAWHNLAYMVMMPVPGTASRYGAINHVVLWIGLVVGLFGFKRRTRLWLASGLVVICVANVVYWNGVYDANLDHMQNVRIAAAHYVRETLPDERCAASDIGALRYHSGRPIRDLGGLVDPEARKWFCEGKYARYLVDNGTSCIILPGQIGAKDEGWFDMAEIYGLTNTSLFEMRQSAIFGIDYDRWLQGYLATNNYQATVVIYQLELADTLSK
jgi:hypothetical protein